MKKVKLVAKAALRVALTAGTMTSCKKEGCTDPSATNYDEKAKKDDGTCEFTQDTTASTGGTTITDTDVSGTTYRMIEGTFSSDFTMTKGTNWMISGGVFVGTGATLTIEAGVTIYAADNGTTPFLSVLQGATIMAVGTAAEPIVFTPVKANPAPGDWGGIIVNGYADINVGETAIGEGDTGTYGGSNDNDNSGTIKYVRVEYAGKVLGLNNELNGFSFNGVGSGTTVEYIQAYRGADDGIEFFGGTVGVKYAVSTGNQDDSFDWTDGWRGKGQFWVVEQNDDAGDRGIEADNNGENNELTPYSNPMIANVTLMGVDDGDGINQAMKLREGTKGKFVNIVATGFPLQGIEVQHSQTIKNMNAGELDITCSLLDNVNPFVYTAGGEAITESMKFENDAMNESAEDGSLVTFLSSYIGTSSGNAFDPSTLSVWFTQAVYKGAVSTGNDWTAGWTKSL